MWNPFSKEENNGFVGVKAPSIGSSTFTNPNLLPDPISFLGPAGGAVGLAKKAGVNPANPFANNDGVQTYPNEAIDMYTRFSPNMRTPLGNHNGKWELENGFEYKPEKLGYQNLNPIFSEQRNKLGSEINSSLASSRNRALMSGGADEGMLERLGKQSMAAKTNAFADLGARQAALESEMRQNVDLTNVQNANNASQFNIRNMFGENDAKNRFDLEKFNTLMSAHGAERTAQAMEKAANKKGTWWDPMGMFS